MLAAIERLQPNLAAWAEESTAAATGPSVGASTAAAAKPPCWKCGNKLLAEEQFCGKCGAPRASDGGPSSMQSKLASAWQMQQAGPEPLAATLPSEISPPTEMMRPFGVHEPQNEGEVEEENAEDDLPEPFSLPEFEESNPLPAPSISAASAERMRWRRHSQVPSRSCSEDQVTKPLRLPS